jgi:hypothetical protein
MTLLEGSKKLAGLTLRPFTFGTLEACEKLSLTLFTSPDAAVGMSPGEIRRQMASFAWVQTESPERIVEAFSSDTAERQISLFQHSLEIDQLDALVSEVTRIAGAIKAVSVEVIPKPSSGKNEETPPPNS